MHQLRVLRSDANVPVHGGCVKVSWPRASDLIFAEKAIAVHKVDDVQRFDRERKTPYREGGENEI
jgi:hypothetical protein